MEIHDLEVVNGAAVGLWIRPRLGGDFGAVTRQVPKGYEAYVRIFHPATDQEGKPLRWAEVAKMFGTTPHRRMQWHALLGLSDVDELRYSYDPETVIGQRGVAGDPSKGAMEIDTLDALCEILAAHTPNAARCFYGLCTIENWLGSFSAEELQPLLKLLHGRDYIVLSGPLAAVDQINRKWSGAGTHFAVFATGSEGKPPEASEQDWITREAPHLIWPADRAWFVASEVDFDSTLVGGRAELIKGIVESPKLEAWQVEPIDSLASDADRINVPSMGRERR